MKGVLDFVSISKTYGGTWRRKPTHALEALSFSLEPGEIFGFLGPNGAGKTTAIHLAMGFMRASAGNGYMLGRPFGDAPTRRRIGFMPESVPLYARKASSLLHFYGALNGMRDPVLRERCRDVLKSVELDQEQQRNVAGFSRGMQQRIGVAQALMNDPELLMLDEPTSALDPLGRITVRELLLAANKRGKTVFLSSHLLSEVELICHRVAILRRGKLVEVLRMSDLSSAATQFDIVVRGIRADGFPGAATGENGTFSLRVLAAAQRETIERIWESGGEVLRVNPATRTLEQVFAQLVGNGSSDQGSDE